MDEVSGKEYYYTAEGAVQWDRPVKPLPPAQTAANAQEFLVPAATCTEDREGGNVKEMHADWYGQISETKCLEKEGGRKKGGFLKTRTSC